MIRNSARGLQQWQQRLLQCDVRLNFFRLLSQHIHPSRTFIHLFCGMLSSSYYLSSILFRNTHCKDFYRKDWGNCNIAKYGCGYDGRSRRKVYSGNKAAEWFDRAECSQLSTQQFQYAAGNSPQLLQIPFAHVACFLCACRNFLAYCGKLRNIFYNLIIWI